MSSYQNRKSHYGDRMILRPSYLHNSISDTGKQHLYTELGPWYVYRPMCTSSWRSPSSGHCWTNRVLSDGVYKGYSDQAGIIQGAIMCMRSTLGRQILVAINGHLLYDMYAGRHQSGTQCHYDAATYPTVQVWLKLIILYWKGFFLLIKKHLYSQT